MKLYIFNPDADLALADGGDNYIAPAAARWPCFLCGMPVRGMAYGRRLRTMTAS